MLEPRRVESSRTHNRPNHDRLRADDADRETLLAGMAEHHTAALISWAVRRGLDSAEAWDLTQSAFEKALRTRPPIRGQADLRAWLQVVMRNELVDIHRTGDRRFRVSHHDPAAQPAPENESPPLWRLVDVETVYQEIPRLSPLLREVFELSVSGCSPNAIAARLGVPVSTVSTRLFRARQRLGELLRAAI